MKHRLEAADACKALFRAELAGVAVMLGWTEDRAAEREVFLWEINEVDVEQPNATGGSNLQMQDDFELVWRIVDSRPQIDPDVAWQKGAEMATTVVDVLLRSDRLDNRVQGLWRAYPSSIDGPNLVTVPEGIGSYSDLSVICRHRFHGGQR